MKKFIGRLISWLCDVTIVAGAVLSATGHASSEVVNLTYFFAVMAAIGGLFTILSESASPPDDPAWWDNSIRAIPCVVFAAHGWWWCCAAWGLNTLGHSMRRQRYADKCKKESAK